MGSGYRAGQSIIHEVAATSIINNLSPPYLFPISNHTTFLGNKFTVANKTREVVEGKIIFF
jgi:hypothetical protein